MLQKFDFKSPCRAAYVSAKLPVSLDEIDKVFGSFVNFYNEMKVYKQSGTVTYVKR